MTTAYLINAKSKSVTQVDDSDYQDHNFLHYPLCDNGDSLYTEEGVSSDNDYFIFPNQAPIFGTALIKGLDLKHGQPLAPSTSLTKYKNNITFGNSTDVFKPINYGQREPAKQKSFSF